MDPSIYLMDEENKLPTKMPEKSETDPVSVTPDDDPARQNPTSVGRNHTENINCTPGHLVSEEGKSVNRVNKVVDSQGESRDKTGSIVDNEGNSHYGF